MKWVNAFKRLPEPGQYAARLRNEVKPERMTYAEMHTFKVGDFTVNGTLYYKEEEEELKFIDWLDEKEGSKDVNADLLAALEAIANICYEYNSSTLDKADAIAKITCIADDIITSAREGGVE